MNDPAVMGNAELLASVVERLPAPTLLVDDGTRVVFMNRAARRSLGVDPDAAQNGLYTRTCNVLHCVNARGSDERWCADCEIRRSVARARATGTVQRGKAFMRLRLGAETADACFLVSVAPVSHERRALALLTLEDVSFLERSAEDMRRMAFHDALTGLPNRLLLRDRLDQAIAAARRSGNKVGVLFIDLDRFKEINDTHGHDAGDEVLKQVSRRVSECLRENDTLSRIGGDEFVAVLQSLAGPNDAVAIADRIREAQSSAMMIRGHALRSSASIGIALFPDHGTDAEALLKRADMAMYRAKGNGRGGHHRAVHEEG